MWESLVSGKARFLVAPGEFVVVANRLIKTLDDGTVFIDGSPVYSHLYFRVLHHMLRMLMSRKWGAKAQGGDRSWSGLVDVQNLSKE